MHHAPTRAHWLGRAVSLLRPAFRRRGFPLPRRLVAQFAVLAPDQTALWVNPPDAAGVVLLSTRHRSPELILASLIHELAHAALGHARHDGEFVALLTSFGIDESAGIGERTRLLPSLVRAGLVRRLGPFPKV